MGRRFGGEGKVSKQAKHRHSHHWIQQQAFEHTEKSGKATASSIFPPSFIQLKEDKADGVEDDEGDGSDQVEEPNKFVAVPKD